MIGRGKKEKGMIMLFGRKREMFNVQYSMNRAFSGKPLRIEH
jgi:hypothetical protein